MSRRDRTLRLRSALALRVHRAPAGEDLVATGGRLDRSHLVAGYVAGAFPMGLGPGGSGALGWFSPDPRGILRPGQVHESRSLRRRSRDFRVTVDTAFDAVVAGCGEPTRPGRWITAGYRRAYRELFDAGLAHSIEVWEGDRLAGGLFGVAVGGLFAAESKFHVSTGASKAAVVALGRICDEDGDARRVIDVQWRTEHLATLGIEEVPRSQYLRLLAAALRAPLPRVFAEASHARAADGPLDPDLAFLVDAALV